MFNAQKARAVAIALTALFTSGCGQPSSSSQLRGTVSIPIESATTVAFSADGRMLAIPMYNSGLALWALDG